jgi:hypothetical protein
MSARRSSYPIPDDAPVTTASARPRSSDSASSQSASSSASPPVPLHVPVVRPETNLVDARRLDPIGFAPGRRQNFLWLGLRRRPTGVAVLLEGRRARGFFLTSTIGAVP